METTKNYEKYIAFLCSSQQEDEIFEDKPKRAFYGILPGQSTFSRADQHDIIIDKDCKLELISNFKVIYNLARARIEENNKYKEALYLNLMNSEIIKLINISEISDDLSEIKLKNKIYIDANFDNFCMHRGLNLIDRISISDLNFFKKFLLTSESQNNIKIVYKAMKKRMEEYERLNSVFKEIPDEIKLLGEVD